MSKISRRAANDSWYNRRGHQDQLRIRQVDEHLVAQARRQGLLGPRGHLERQLQPPDHEDKLCQQLAERQLGKVLHEDLQDAVLAVHFLLRQHDQLLRFGAAGIVL